MKKILHVITNLGIGGAERNLLIIANLLKEEYLTEIVVLGNNNLFEKELLKEGMKVHCLGINSLFSFIKGIREFKKIEDSFKPDIIMSWLYHADFFTSIYKILINRNIYLIWNIRALNLKNEKLPTKMISYINGVLSQFVNRIIFNSNNAKTSHASIGYQISNAEYIPNGIDTEKFRFNSKKRRRIRKALSIADNIFLVGVMGRYHKVKGIEFLLKGYKDFSINYRNTRLLLVGNGFDKSNKELSKLILDYSLKNEVILAGSRDRPENYYSAFDVFVSSSLSEGFPNTLAEAVSTEITVISTNVGDSNMINTNKDFLINPSSYGEISSALKLAYELSDIQKSAMNLIARENLLLNFSMNTLKKNYLKLLDSSFEITN